MYLGLVILAFIVVDKLFFALVIAGIQYFAPYVISKLRLNSIGVLNFDTEVSNLLVIAATRFLSPVYALVIIGATMAIHAFHEEVTDMHSFLESAIRGIILIAVVALFGTTPLLVLIPWAILVAFTCCWATFPGQWIITSRRWRSVKSWNP